MDFKSLQSFLILAEELNFRRTAERLRITQPALSRQIRLLEEELGGRLFERTSRRVILTEAGSRFLDEARAATQQLQHAAEVGRDAMKGRLGLVRIGTTAASMFNPRTTDILHAHRTRWPRVNLELLEMPAPEQFAALEQSRIDAGFVHVDADFISPANRRRWKLLRFDVVAREGLVVAVSSGHRLARHPTVRLTDLVDEEFLTLPRRYSPDYGGPFHWLEKLKGAPVQLAQEARDAPAMVHLAAAGFGVALVPESLTSIHAPRVRFVRVADEKVARVLCLVSLHDDARPAVRNFMAEAQRSKPKA